MSSPVTNQHKTKHPTYCNIQCVLFKVSKMCHRPITFQMDSLVMIIVTAETKMQLQAYVNVKFLLLGFL